MKTSKILLAIAFLSITHIYGQDPQYEVFALKYADIGNEIPLSFLVKDAPENQMTKAIFMFWLVKGDNGKIILIDAGFLNDIEEAIPYNVTNYTQPDQMLQGLGIKASDITDIIITHPHWDHMDGVDLFPNAEVWIQKEDYNFFVGEAWQNKETKEAFNPRDVRKLIELNLKGKLKLINGDAKQLFPGITVFTGSRHTFESQYVQIISGTQKTIIASDNIYLYYNLDHLMSAPENFTFSTQGYINSMKRMKTLVSDIKYVIPGHDPALFKRFTEISKDIVKIN